MERNKVLDLYVERKREEIKNKYKEIIDNEYNELQEVKEYNEIVNEFNAKMEELVIRTNKEDYKPFVQTGYSDTHKYEIADYLKNDIAKGYREWFEKEMKELDSMANEIHAQLSMSEDKDYQIEVLKNYGILDKKTSKLTI